MYYTGGAMLAKELTGSVDVKSYIDALIAAGPSSKGKKDIVPYQAISGSGNAYFVAPLQKRVIKIARGTEVYVLPMDPDDQDRYHVVDLTGRYFMVPGDEILDIGFN
jgi:hypothetical protein|tara:strand:+ start:1306 stop:1626 length:321 start_codon:yes stop_codon:yes gene_type:complete